MKKSLVFLLAIMISNFAHAQCAMCRATLENNVSQGNIGIAAGINFGILYLLAVPYLAFGVIWYFWYKSSRKNVNTGLDSIGR
ncbi:MAG: hypothetical protein FJZ78_07470 [Bacteroidetes bacterium]|nr:hypothetical protein [Bacteroidota bacterium]